ncbi:hypothetical protein K7J14_07305 [Treponema zuelzerae]|uniref:Uncharacterized protein n=1 Tax=Teretinema zuelzerae TaxID=156 RepID=A0AAE3EHJ1_9SPIR|nr:hypothetical protein [Teretinema zuelzerae]MCD1654511.1 hypothetical protein [Teretinema zuelzerae]
MSQYDEETGLVLSDEDEIAREAALEEEKGTEDVSSEKDGASVEPKTVVPRINKNSFCCWPVGLLPSSLLFRLSPF